MKDTFINEFSKMAASADRDLATPALMIAKLECPSLDPGPSLERLDAMGAAAHERLVASGCLVDSRHSETAVDILNAYLFDEEGFTGNRDRYDDPSNSFLNEVLERRTGIPITLALVYMEVARRAGILIDGVNFPGHFLMRFTPLILDPFHRGARLSENDCRRLLQRHIGEEAAFDPASARAGDETADADAHAAEPEAHLRPAALVPAGPQRHGAAAGGRSAGAGRAARPGTCWPIT